MSKLNLGCGVDYKGGWVNLDRSEVKGKVDVIHDLERTPLPFEDNTFDYVFGQNILEHITNLESLMEDIHRILKPDGIFEFRVPHFKSINAPVPCHVRLFSARSFRLYFGNACKGYGQNTFPPFEKVCVRLRVMYFHFYLPELFELLSIIGLSFFYSIEFKMKAKKKEAKDEQRV